MNDAKWHIFLVADGRTDTTKYLRVVLSSDWRNEREDSSENAKRSKGMTVLILNEIHERVYTNKNVVLSVLEIPIFMHFCFKQRL